MTINHTIMLAPLATALFSYSSAILAATPSTPSAVESITVTGSYLPFSLQQLPASVSVLTADDIAASGAIQLTELLRGMPGVSIAGSGSPGSLTEIRVRGSESNHLLVLIDGVVANDIGQGSLVDLAHLTTANVRRIELLRGPQSALWGSGAVGGVLSITTANGSDTTAGNHISATAGAGTQQTWRGSMNAVSQHEQGSLRTYASYFTTDGSNIARTGSEPDGYENMTAGINAQATIHPQHTLSLAVRTVNYENDYDSTDYVGTGLPADADNVTHGEQVSANATWRFAAASLPYESQLSLQYRKDENRNTVAGYEDGGTTGKRLQTRWLNRYLTNDGWQLAGGLDYLQRFFEQQGPVVFGDPNQSQHDTTSSVFAELGRQFDALTATVNARYDNNSEYDNATSYRAGLSWHATSHVTAFASLGQAVKTPTFTERFGYFPGSFIGNPELEPETSTEAELGIRFDYRHWQAQLSTYDTRLQDEILGYVFVSDLGGATALNASGDSRRQGVDTSMTYIGDLAEIVLSYSYLDASQNDDTGALAELRRARHQGSLTLRSDLGNDKVGAYARLAYTGSRTDTFFPPFPAAPETVALRPYSLLTVNLRYALTPHWSLALRIDNALDAQYEDIVGYQGNERRAMASVGMQF
ncbi:TonB-dependent receptor [Alteromonas sp. ASW11-19]|uniref:TonB-dependent receptor n=1 Tax=Alteromonas salexigens TaxID=2982530 RepID=A0ABT2VIS1_9ALTE|nr:TonB-dependent receptor [Alteromonas salexigens]MCU7553055.1 TonB-dependent receptor [Alteromonas salexigens]